MAIPNSFEFRLVGALINTLREWMLEDADDITNAIDAAQARRDEGIRRMATEFLERYPNPRDGADLLEESMRWSEHLEAQVRLDPSQLLAEMCRCAPEYGTELCRIMIAESERHISKCFHSLLHALRDVDPGQAAGVIRDALATDNHELLVSVAYMYRFCDRISSEDVTNITGLLGHSEPLVKTQAIHALQRLGREDPQAAVALARKVEIGSSKDMAEALFGIFDPQHGIAPTLLDEGDVRELMAKLEHVEAIDGIEVGQFLAQLSRTWPSLVVRMLLHRIANGQPHESGYEPFPVEGLHEGLDGLADSVQYDSLLRLIREAALKKREASIHSPLSKLFWQASRTRVDYALTVLSEWIDTKDADKLHALGELLRACPR